MLRAEGETKLRSQRRLVWPRSRPCSVRGQQETESTQWEASVWGARAGAGTSQQPKLISHSENEDSGLLRILTELQ